MLYAAACRDGKDETLRMFYLSSCERALRGHWKSLAPAEKAAVRERALELVYAGTGPAETAYIRNKVIAILVELAKRDWSDWGDFLPKLLNEIALKGIPQAVLVMGIIRDLAEDCTNADFNNSLRPSRRTEILTSVRENMGKILPLCFKYLERCYMVISSGQQDETKLAEALARSTLLLLESCAELSPLEAVAETNVLAAAQEFTKPLAALQGGAILGEKRLIELQHSAWRCASAFAARKTVSSSSQVNEVEWVNSLLAPYVGPSAPPLRGLFGPNAAATEAVWPTFSIGNDRAEEAMAFAKVLVVHKEMALGLGSICTNMTASLMATANSGKDPRALGVLQTLLNVMVRFLSHPSPTVRSVLFPGVSAFFRCVPDQGAPLTGPADRLAIEALPLIFRCLGDHVLLLGHPSSPQSKLWPSSVFAVQEFDDETEFHSQYMQGRAATGVVFKVIAGKRPLECFTFLRQRIEIACSGADLPSTAQVEGGELLRIGRGIDFSPGQRVGAHEDETMFTPTEAYFRATLVDLVDYVAKNIPKAVLQAFGNLGGQVVQPSPEQVAHYRTALELRQATEQLLAFECKEAYECLGCAHALSRFGEVCGSPPDGPNTWLGRVLEKLFSCATFRTADEVARNLQANNLSPATQVARRRGAQALVEICTSLSRADSAPEIRSRLASLLPSFCDQVLRLVRDPVNSTSPYEELLMYEVLVLVSNTLEDAGVQSKFVADILQSPLEKWNDPKLTQMVAEPALLANVMREEAVVRARAGVPNNAQFSEPHLIQIKRAMSLLISVARKSQSVRGAQRPFARFWINVLPNVFALAHTLHRMWKDRAQFAELVYIHPEELRCLVGKGASKSNGGPDKARKFAEATVNSGVSQALLTDAFTAAGAASSPTSRAQQQQQEDTRIMYGLYLMANYREFTYSILGVAARYGEQGIFAIPEAVQNIPSVLFADIETMEHRHLARLFTAFLVPYAHHCPKQLWAQVLFPLLTPVLEHTYKRLQMSWPRLTHLKRSTSDPGNRGGADGVSAKWNPVLWKHLDMEGDGDSDDDGLALSTCADGRCGECALCAQSDMARDTSIRILGAAFVELQSTVLDTGSDIGVDPKDLKLKELGQHALGDQALATALLLSLTSVLSSGDGPTMNKGALLLRRLLFSTLLVDERFARFAVTRLFATCFGTLYAPPNPQSSNDNFAQSVLQSLTHIWTFAINGSVLMHETQAIKCVSGESNPYRRALHQTLFEGLPGLSQQQLDATEATMINSRTNRSRRNAVRDFLQDCVHDFPPAGERQEALFPKPNKEVEFQPKQQAKKKSFASDQGANSWVDAQNAWDLGVQALFQGS